MTRRTLRRMGIHDTADLLCAFGLLLAVVGIVFVMLPMVILGGVTLTVGGVW